jgi:hypothetical protein
MQSGSGPAIKGRCHARLRFLHKADYQTPGVSLVSFFYLPFACLLPVTQLAAIAVACSAEAVKDLPLLLR